MTGFPRLTECLRRIDGGWTIVHEHHSVPADPAK
ncbi:MAG: nuclear transport factor 2 family protein [Gammaproteobacteria bacterium]